MANVKIHNKSTLPFIDAYAGQEYVIDVGESANVPAGASHLWFGRPNEDPAKAFKRTRRRKGAFYKQLDDMEVTSVDERKAREKLKAAMNKMRGDKPEAVEKTFSGFAEEEEVGDEEIGFLED